MEKEIYDIIKKMDNPLSVLLNYINTLKNENGFTQDVLTPGFLKEWVISEILGHRCHKTKHGPDATSLNNDEKYEYLSCKEGGSFQLDRIHKNNLHRITRNDKFFFASFNKSSGLECVKIWKCDMDVVLTEAKIKINSMSESSKHISFSETWVKNNCEIVYSLD
jgi:hypothetical protein